MTDNRDEVSVERVIAAPAARIFDLLADPAGYERFLAERGARQLPNPPIDMPEWLEDTRS